jgi:aldehyde dehydrogenase (NAD+)
MEEAKHFIGGEWINPADSTTIAVLDPSDGQPFARLARGGAADIDAAVRAARRGTRAVGGANF